jgi:hypothetical protein
MARRSRLTAEEAAERLGLSVSRITEMARAHEIGRKDGGRWTFSEAEIRRVAKEREDRAKALKLRKRLENDRRRLNGLPPKRKRRKKRPSPDDDLAPWRQRRPRTIDDVLAVYDDPLYQLDRLLAQERALEQRYQLPFRAPHRTETTLTACQRCGQPLLFLIFGDHATDAAGLDAYGRLMEQPIRQHGLSAYVLSQPNGRGDDAISLLRRVWPDASDVIEMTPNRWDAFVAALSVGHGCGAATG